ncbi:PrsW family glutamic-type intramembrane protease [Catenulispora rubra]|uniref:PrsW family glutamic-type intramembrane protease n=1 Tax=Catenulispora rubra TaxID=280293 RepID=UPI001891F8CD|nr:PrsW family glutamic-type intramembrane protease [Catenulispora rubra]
MTMAYSPPPPPVGMPPAAALRAAKSGVDRRLALLAVAALAVSVAGIVLRALHLLPASAAVGIGFGAVAISLRILLLFSARSAAAAHRAKVLNRVSLAGLAVSGAVLVGTLPRITKAGGMGPFFGDVFAHGWTLAIVTVAAGSVRTFTWRVHLGAGLTGLLAVSALVRVVNVPIYNHYGPDSLLEGAVIGPAIEEVFKALLLVLIVWLAARRREVRPSAVDITLLGMWVGAGFALYEDAMFGRGGAHFGGAAPFSVIFPTQAQVSGLNQVGAGHLLYTGVVGLGLGIGVLYRRRWRFAWLAAPAGLLVAFAEHASWNGKALAGDAAPGWIGLLSGVTLWGRLSSVLLIGGVAAMVVVEWRRATKAPAFWNGAQQQKQVGVPHWLWLTAAESGRRSTQLAQLQTSAPQSVPQSAPQPGPWHSAPFGGQR